MRTLLPLFLLLGLACSGGHLAATALACILPDLGPRKPIDQRFDPSRGMHPGGQQALS